MQKSLADRLLGCYSGAVYDVIREFGAGNCVLPNTIQCVNPALKIAGPAFTMTGARAKLDAHQTLLRWTEFLSKAPPGSVVVCQPNDGELAHMGELSSETLMYKGVKGYVVDGGTRDTEFVLKIGFPVFCKYRTPADVVGRWAPTAFEEPIEIGGVTIHNGDIIFGDIDGVLVIPQGIAEKVIERVEEVMRTENLVRKAILQGTDPQKAYLQYGLF